MQGRVQLDPVVTVTRASLTYFHQNPNELNSFADQIIIIWLRVALNSHSDPVACYIHLEWDVKSLAKNFTLNLMEAMDNFQLPCVPKCGKLVGGCIWFLNECLLLLNLHQKYLELYHVICINHYDRLKSKLVSVATQYYEHFQ